MTQSKRESLIVNRSPNICPVCGKVSYSRGGVHPQCSMLQADLERTNQIKSSKPAKSAERQEKSVSRWQKQCPKCRSLQHVRKKMCDCGHQFKVNSRPETEL